MYRLVIDFSYSNRSQGEEREREVWKEKDRFLFQIQETDRFKTYVQFIFISREKTTNPCYLTSNPSYTNVLTTQII